VFDLEDMSTTNSVNIKNDYLHNKKKGYYIKIKIISWASFIGV